jgi:hypothetical protein
MVDMETGGVRSHQVRTTGHATCFWPIHRPGLEAVGNEDPPHLIGGRSPRRARIDRRRAAQERTGNHTVDSAATQVLPDHHHGGMRPGAAASSYSRMATSLPLACPSPRYRSASGTSRNR